MSAVESQNRNGAKPGPTNQRILDTAEQLFAENGFAGTSIRDVTELVGIKKASFYSHFASKGDLYDAVLERGFEPMLGILTAFIASGREAYENPQLPASIFAKMAERPNFARLLQFECLRGGDRLKALLHDWIEDGVVSGVQAMHGSEHGKHWREDELQLLIFYTFAMFLGYFTLQPLYELQTGEQAMSPKSIARQQRFLSHWWHRIWYDDKRPSSK